MKENIVFRSYSFLSPKRQQKSRQDLHEIFLKPQYKCLEVPQFSISTHLFSIAPYYSRITQIPGQSQQNGKQCSLPPLFFKINLKETSFHISINSLGLYLSPECLLNFLSNVYTPPCVVKISKLIVFTLPENVLNLGIFTHAPLPTQNLSPSSYYQSRGRGKLLIPPRIIFSNICFPQQQKGVEETMICFIEIQLENIKMAQNIRLFIFFMICNFFECDYFTVL